MNIRFLNFIIGVLSILFIGCNKEGAGCFDKAGEIRTVLVDVPDFSGIDVSTNVDVQLLISGPDRVEITVGENLISGINLVVENGILKIDNLNSCFWSRGYVNPLVAIRNVALENVIQHGYGRIYTTDTLIIPELSIQVEDASGTVELMIKANLIKVVSNNIGPVRLKGSSTSLNVGHYWSDGVLYAKNLIVQDCSINHNGSNRMEVNVVNSLTGSINSIGGVYLYGQKPAIIDVDLTDEGVIIENY